MKRIFNPAKITIIFLLLIQSFSPVFLISRADYAYQIPNQDICSGPSKAMGLYQEFQAEMAQLLLGGTFEEKKYEMLTNPNGLFNYKVLFLSTTNSAPNLILSSLLKSSYRLLQTFITTSTIFTLSAISTVSSNVEGIISILAQDRPIVRDFKTLLEIETRITQIAYYLSVNKASIFGGKMKTPLGLVSLMKRYEELGMFEGVDEKDEVSYIGILSDLMRLNASMKFRLTTDIQLFNTVKYNGLLKAKISSTFLKQLSDDYTTYGLSIVGISKCNTSRKSLMKDLSSISQMGQAFKNAGAILANSGKRLGYALWDIIPDAIEPGKSNLDSKFDATELAQLRSIYGIDTSQLTDTEIVRFINRISPIGGRKKAGNDIKKTGSDILKKVYKPKEKTDTNFDKMNSEERVKEFRDKGKYYSNYFDDKLHENMKLSVIDAEDLAYDMFNEMVIDNTSTDTLMFKAILDQIETLNTEVIGKDKTTETGLRKKIGTICENQAKNKGISDCRPS